MRYFLLCLLLTGCQQPLQVIVSKQEVPILIERDGSFVTKNDFIKLLNGQTVKYYNGRINKYYLPSTLIDIDTQTKSIKLKGK